ncbi:MAG: hypothetical protein ACYDHA_12635 [Bellilinea sp.]
MLLLMVFADTKDTSDSPLLLRFSNLQKECYTNHASIGGLLIKQEYYDPSISELEIALEIGYEINDKALMAKASGNLANVYIIKNQFDKAIQLLKSTIQITEEIEIRDVYARACWSLGSIYEIHLDFDNAIKYLRTAVITFKALNMIEYEQASSHLKELRKALGLL